MFFLPVFIWQHLTASVAISSADILMLAATRWATTLASSSMVDWLSSYCCAFQSLLLLACQPSDGGAMMILAPTVIRSGVCPLSARKMLSCACPIFCMSHQFVCGICRIFLCRRLLVWSDPGFSVVMLVVFVLDRCARWLVLLCPFELLVVVVFFCYCEAQASLSCHALLPYLRRFAMTLRNCRICWSRPWCWDVIICLITMSVGGLYVGGMRMSLVNCRLGCAYDIEV